MKKFNTVWYQGCITEDPTKKDFIKEVLVETVVNGNSIEDIKILEILPEEEKKKYFHRSGGYGYVRSILCDDKNRICDYGSHDKFIWISEIQ